MKFFRMLGRGIRDSFRSVIRNFSLSLASIVSITITLFVISSALLASFNVKYFTKEIKEDVTMIVFINSKATKEDIDHIDKEMQKISNITSIVFKSKFEKKDELSKESETFKAMFEGWDDSEIPIKDSFMVKVQDLTKIKETSNKIKEIPKVDVVNYGASMIEKMLGAFDLLEKGMIIVVGILIVVTIFLIINTIKLAIAARHREIEIMRVVGASNFYIKYPFIIEGMILGFVGAILPVIFTVYGYTTLYNHFGGIIFTPIIKLIPPTGFVLKVSAGLIAIGILVGMFGSARAVRKYLKI